MGRAKDVTVVRGPSRFVCERCRGIAPHCTGAYEGTIPEAIDGCFRNGMGPNVVALSLHLQFLLGPE